MKFTTIIVTFTMAVASTQALSYEFSDSQPVRRSGVSNSAPSRSPALLDYTTRELVTALETRLAKRAPVLHGIGHALGHALVVSATDHVSGVVHQHYGGGGGGGGSTGGETAPVGTTQG